MCVGGGGGGGGWRGGGGGGGGNGGRCSQEKGKYYLYSSMYAEKYYFTGELEAFYRLR